MCPPSDRSRKHSFTQGQQYKSIHSTEGKFRLQGEGVIKDGPLTREWNVQAQGESSRNDFKGEFCSLAQIRKDIYSQGEWNLGNGLDIRGTGTRMSSQFQPRVPKGPQSRE